MIDDRCKCADETDIRAPWLYMGPWHSPDCWLFAAVSPLEAEE